MFVTTIICLVLAAILLPESAQSAPPCHVVCPYLLQKVCGSNGITYDNACLLRAAKECNNVDVKLAKQGACEDQSGEDCTSPKDVGVCRGIFPRWHYDVVTDTCKPFSWGGCGGNNNKYKTKKECEDTCIHPNGFLDCPTRCPNTLAPVCGSDAVDYDNFCQFQMAVGCDGKDIYVQHEGRCNEADVNAKGYVGCPSSCPNTMQPVCGSDGDDYDNFCQFQVAAGCWGKDIFVKHEGKCTESEKKQ